LRSSPNATEFSCVYPFAFINQGESGSPNNDMFDSNMVARPNFPFSEKNEAAISPISNEKDFAKVGKTHY